MRLLFENWRKFIIEDWRDTSWETDDEKATIRDVVDYLATVKTKILNLDDLEPKDPETLEKFKRMFGGAG